MYNNRSQIGSRLRAAREAAGLTQQQLAAELGFEHRQTLASIEAGERRLSAEELLRAVRLLNVDLDYFTDSFRLVGEGQFSFRTTAGVHPEVLDSFEDQAGRWIATYRELGAQQGEEPQWLEYKLSITSRSSFEEAQAAAEAIGARWQLGERPAERLWSAVENNLNALVLNVDAPAGVSGAASQAPGLGAVLVNRHEPESRRNYDLAHELFHLLTWDVMPPKRLEIVADSHGVKGKRVEQLAENFAAALLMPEPVMRGYWQRFNQRDGLHEWLNQAAQDLRVSPVACTWRLHNLGFLSKADIRDVWDSQFLAYGRGLNVAPQGRLFSERFVQRIAAALDSGRLSVKRAASLLGLSMGELAALLQDYGIEPSFEA